MHKIKGLKVLKIGDFNISKIDITAFIKHTASAHSALANATTLPYRAPEIFADKVSSCKVDVWAIGIILYLLCHMKHPFEGQNKTTEAMMRNIVENPAEISSNIDSDF